MARHFHKTLRTGFALTLAITLCACAGESDSADAASVNDTLAVSTTASTHTDSEIADSSANKTVSTGTDAQDSGSNTENNSSSASSAASDDEYTVPDYVFNALLKSSAKPAYQEINLKDTKTDRTDSSCIQVDYGLTPINMTSLDSENGLQDNGLVTVNTKEITPLEANVPKGYDDAFVRLNADAKEARDRYEIVFSNMQSRKNKTSYFGYLETLDLIPCRLDTTLFSVVQVRKITGEGEGAKQASSAPTLSFKSINIDGKTGKTLTLSDMVKNKDELALLAAEMLYKVYVTDLPYQNASSLFTEKELKATLTKLFADEKEEENLYAWAPSYLGLHLFIAATALTDSSSLEEYRINVNGSKDLDTFEVIIPYRYAPSLFTPAYTTIPDNFMARLQPGAAYAFDFGTGLVSFRLCFPMEEDNMKYIAFADSYNICMEELDMDIPTVSANSSATTGVAFYLVRNNGNIFLYIQQMTTEKDGAKLQIFKFKEYDNLHFFEMTGVSDDMLDPAGAPPLNPVHFRSRRKANILPDPTYGRMSNLYRSVFVTENGLPGCDDTFFDVEGDFVRTTAVDLNLEVLTNFEKELTETRLFPAGTKLMMFRAQLLPYTQADFTTQDGTVVRLHVNGVDAIDNVDGYMVEEAFKY